MGYMVIREYELSDEDALIGLSLRAWGPAFASFEDILGAQIFSRIYGDDWCAYQREEVRRVLHDKRTQAWVAEDDSALMGWVAAVVHSSDDAEIDMLAVEPGAGGTGIGTALVEHATKWLTSINVRLVSIATAADASHAAARSVYEKAGYRPLPLVRYYKVL